MKKLLTTSVIINSIFMLLFLSLDNLLLSSILLGISLFYLSIIDRGITRQSRNILLVVSIVNLLLNTLAGTIALIGYGYSEKEPLKILTEEEKKNKRISSILNVGALFVILSGYIFVTSSKDSFSDVAKVLFLLCSSFLFYFLHFFTEKNLKMNFSSKIYCFISFVFLGFSYYSLGKYGILGSFFSVIGEGKSLFFMTNFLVDFILCYLLFRKYNNKSLFYGSIFCAFLSCIHLFLFLKMDLLTIFCLFTLLVTLSHFFEIKRRTSYAVYVILLLLVLSSIFSTYSTNCILLSLLVILQIANLFVFSKKYENSFSYVITIIFGILSILNFGFRITDNINVSVPTLAFGFALFYIFVSARKTFSKEKGMMMFVSIIINLLFLGFYLTSMFLSLNSHLVVALSIILTNLVYLTMIKERSFEYYLDPVKKCLCLSSCIYAFSDLYFHYSFFTGISILSLLICLFFIVNKDKVLKSIYFSFILFLLVLGILLGFVNYEFFPLLILIVSTLMLYLSVKKQKDFSFFEIPIYIILLFMINYCFVNLPYIKIDLLGYFIVFIIYSLFLWKNAKNRKDYMITSYMFVLPFLSLISSNIYNNDLKMILYNLLGFYLLHVTNHSFIKKESTKVVITDMVVIALLCMVVFSDSILLSIYVGIVSFILLSIGFGSKTYEHLFSIAIVATILNIIIVFKDLLLSLNAWIYLLIIGILMIVFATYNEMKK